MTPPPLGFAIVKRRRSGYRRRVAAAMAFAVTAAVLAPVGTSRSAAQSSGGGALVVAWGGSLSDVGTAASLVAAGEGAAVVYAQSPQSLGFESAALVEQVAPQRVLLVGGTAVLEESIETELRGLASGVDIDRLAGASRIETAALAAERVLGDGETVVVANGWSLPDVGAAAASVAAGVADAVLYAAKDGLGEETRRVLSDRSPSSVLIAGGTAALSNGVAAEAATEAGSDTRRLGGATRVETAAFIAAEALNAGAEVAVVANGWSLNDVGIAASLAAGIPGSAVLYAADEDELGNATSDLIEGRSLRRIFVVGRVDRVGEHVFGVLGSSAATTRIESPVAAARQALGLSGSPDGLAVLESVEVGPQGATVQAAGATVVVPSGAVEAGTTVSIQEPTGRYEAGEFGGHVVSVDHDGPVRAPISVTWDLSHLTEEQTESVLMVSWDDTLGLWVPTYEDFEMVDGNLTVRTAEWSWRMPSWRDIARGIHEFATNTVQTGKEVLGWAVDAPKCSPPPQPNWVHKTSEPGTTRHAAIRLCYEAVGENALRMRAANNRTVSQLVYNDTPKGWGQAWRDPEFGFVYTLNGAFSHAAYEVLSNSDRAFVPPLSTTNVDIQQPDQTGRHTMRLSAKIEWSTVAADFYLFVLDDLNLDGRILGTAGQWGKTLSPFFGCSLVAIDGATSVSLQDARDDNISQVISGMPGLFRQCAADLNSNLERDAGKYRQNSRWSGTPIPAHDKNLSRLAGKLGKAVKYKAIADLVQYFVDLDQYESDTWTIKADGVTVPGMPTVRARGSAGSATATWSVDANSSPVDKWEVSLSGEGNRIFRDRSKTEHQWSGLTEGRYTLRIRAGNKAGWGNWSNSSTIYVASASQPGNIAVRTISAGGSHSCAIRTNRTLHCDGDNYSGKASPPAGQFVAVDDGDWHSCGIRIDGTVQCWGRNDFGESNPPAGTFTAVASGTHYTCGIRVAGAIECWGADGDRQSTPPVGQFTAIDTGGRHACGIRD